jgi:hypothetical protein
MNPGEYTQPLVRTMTTNVPVVSGYVAARWKASDAIQPVISGEDTYSMVTFENLSNTACSVKLRQTNDRTISGTRIDVISGVTLVAGGRRTLAATGIFQQYMELFCYGGGPSEIRMQLASQRQWEAMAFDKAADSTFYPTSLWQAKAYPTAPSFPTTPTN